MATSKQMPPPTASRTPKSRRRVRGRLGRALGGRALGGRALGGRALGGRALGGRALAGLMLIAGCSAEIVEGASPSSTVAVAVARQPTTTPPPTPLPTAPEAEPLPTTATIVQLPTRPAWLGTRDLTLPDGSIPTGLATPSELLDRRFATIDVLRAPAPGTGFAATIDPLDGDELETSTWEPGCPVSPDQLRYLTITFWGFDERPHTGEMIVNTDVANDVVDVFRQLYDERFPIEEMRIITDADLTGPNSGDGNITSAFVCRAVRGGSAFSEHAYGLAIDINPFLNPYLRGDVLLPELARHYLPRDLQAPGQIVAGDAVTRAFDEIGWGWGGEWSSLVDFQHFALNNR